MTQTQHPASVEVAHSKRKGKTLDTRVVVCNDGTLYVEQQNDEVILMAQAYSMLLAPESGRAYVTLSREAATALCKDLAERLDLDIDLL